MGESGGGNFLVDDYKDVLCEQCDGDCTNCIKGKSTVASLLERFYDPTSGVIMLDGLDIRTLDLSWMRGQVIGFINQVLTDCSSCIKF